MENIMILIAVALFIIAIIVGIITDNTWKNVGICWGLLAIGALLFGTALTL